jgi:hypothetical protein
MTTLTNTLTQASQQWASRPDDQRYLSLAELKAAVDRRKVESWTATPSTKNVRVRVDDGQLGVELYDPTHGERRTVAPSHWGFGQLAQYAGAPASYLRKLPAELAAINVQWGLENNPLRDDGLFLAQSNGHHVLRSITSPSYGRIWDSQVVSAVEKVNADGRWQIPAASYATSNPKRATTLYASDRDVFIFLVDPGHEIEVAGEKLYRGFFTWNSEVGAGTFGICTFLYRFVCDNRIIWGATNVRELRIRHTGGAPERFAYEGAKYLRQYSEEATAGIVSQITKAKALEIEEAKKPDGMAEWLQDRGFSKSIAKASVDAAVAEEGKARSLWDIVNGITAHARSLPYANERVELETKAGNLMKLVG